MPNFLIDEDTDLLAAEFVLGTLDAEERANAQSLLRMDHGFIAMVRIWERRLSELHLMVEPVDPDPKILERIRAKLPQTPQNEPPASARAAAAPPLPSPEPAAPVMPPDLALEPPESTPAVPPDSTIEAAAVAPAAVVSPDADATKPPEEAAEPEMQSPDLPPAPALEVAPSPELRLPEAVVRSERGAADKAPVLPPPAPPKIPDKPPDLRPPKRPDVTIEVIRSRGRWRAFSVILLLAVAAVAALVAAWRFVPDRVPLALRPSQVMTALGVVPGPGSPGARRPAPPSAQFDE